MTNEYYGAHNDLVPGTKARSGDINTMDQAIVEAFDKLPSAQSMKTGTMNYAVNGSVTTNAYTVAMDGAITSYTDGLEVKLKPVMANTGPATLNINGIGNVVIKRQDGTNLLAGDLLAQGPLTLTYNASANAFFIPPTGNAHVKAAASTATTKASEAAASADTATAKAGEAAGSASAAATAASVLASAVSSATQSATTATGAATTASTKASEAATSASNAATSATNLSSAVSAAQAAQSLAQQWASGTGIIASGKYSAEYYANQAASYAGAVASGQMNADWNVTDPASKAYILNKPVISVAANFPAGNTHTVSSEPNTLRSVSNPSTLGYAGGVRFRFGYMDDSGFAAGTADIVDFSTYTDNTGGGVNALYLRKDQQRIVHKFAGTGATAWTTQTLAYLSDLSVYLPLTGGTMAGNLMIDTSGSERRIQFSGGGFSAGFFGLPGGDFGMYDWGKNRSVWWYKSSDNTLSIYTSAVTLPNTTVNGTITTSGGFIGNLAGNASTATNATNAANADKLGGLPLGTNATGNTWGFVPRVGTDGVMEVGFAVDFHNASAEGVDYAVRLSSSGADLLANGNKLLHTGITRTNYKGVTDSFVAGQLMWKGSGNNHTIFDASGVTSPSGGTINMNDATQPWVPNANRPVLMGWNGSDTWGVRVDSARVADSVAPNAVLVKPVIKGYIEQVQTLTSGAGGVTINPDNGTIIYIDITANTTITLPPAVAGLAYSVIVNFNGGPWTLNFAGGTAIRWAGGAAPAATSVAGRYDKYVYTCLAGVTFGQDGGRNF
jgi:hypothetical protein